MKENEEQVIKAIKSWRLVCLTTVTLAVGFYLYVQGSHIGIPGTISDKTTRYTAAVYGQLVLIPLCAFFYSYTFHIAKLFSKKGRLLRIPLLYELHLPDGNSLMKKASITSLLVIFIVPMFSLGHCYKKSLHGTVYINDACKDNVCKEVWSSDAKGALTKFSKFSEIFSDGNRYRFDGQISYFPGWQPWLSLILIIWVFFLWGKAIKLLFHKKNE